MVTVTTSDVTAPIGTEASRKLQQHLACLLTHKVLEGRACRKVPLRPTPPRPGPGPALAFLADL